MVSQSVQFRVQEGQNSVYLFRCGGAGCVEMRCIHYYQKCEAVSRLDSLASSLYADCTSTASTVSVSYDKCRDVYLKRREEQNSKKASLQHEARLLPQHLEKKKHYHCDEQKKTLLRGWRSSTSK